MQKARIGEHFRDKRANPERSILKATVNTAACYWQKTTSIWTNGTRVEINQHCYTNCTQNKNAINILTRKNNWRVIYTRLNLDPWILPYTQIHSSLHPGGTLYFLESVDLKFLTNFFSDNFSDESKWFNRWFFDKEQVIFFAFTAPSK